MAMRLVQRAANDGPSGGGGLMRGETLQQLAQNRFGAWAAAVSVKGRGAKGVVRRIAQNQAKNSEVPASPHGPVTRPSLGIAG
jgi:hypothetical protein